MLTETGVSRRQQCYDSRLLCVATYRVAAGLSAASKQAYGHLMCSHHVLFGAPWIDRHHVSSLKMRTIVLCQ